MSKKGVVLTLNPPKPNRKRKKKMPFFSTRTLCWALTPVLLISAVWLAYQSHQQIQELTSKRDELIKTQQALIQERDFLKSRSELLQDPDYLLAYAKKKLKYTENDNLLFLLPGDE